MTPEEEQLLSAIERKDVEEVRSLLTKGVSANTKLDQGINAIMYAIVVANKDIVQLFIEHGADVNVQYSHTEQSLHSQLTCAYTPTTFAFINGDGGNIDILELLLKAGATPNTTYTAKNEDTNVITMHSVLSLASSKTLFLFLIFGAELKNEDLVIIRKNDDLQACLKAFKEIKAMPYLGKLIEENIKRDKKKSVEAIAEYINDEANGQGLISKFKIIKEKYGSDEQLSFILECLLGYTQHLYQQYSSIHKNNALKTGALAGIISVIISDKENRNISLNDLEVKDYGFDDKDILNLRSTYKMADENADAYYKRYETKIESLLTKLKDTCQNPNTSLAEAHPEAASVQGQSAA